MVRKEIKGLKRSEAPRPQGGASRARSGEQEASKGNFILIVPLDPAYKAGLAGYLPVKIRSPMRRKTLFDKRQRLPAKAILSALFFVLLFLGFLCGTNSCGRQDVQSVKPIETTAPSPYQWAIGECNTYRLSYSSSSSSDFRVLFGDIGSAEPKGKTTPSGLAYSFETTVNGSLTRTVLEKKGNNYLVVHRIQNPLVNLIANGYNDIQQADAVRADLEKEAFALVSPQGKIHSVLLDPSMGDLSQSYVRSILALTQFVFPGEKISEGTKWEVQEEDPSGQYFSAYEICRDEDTKITKSSVKSFCKRKTRYLEDRPRSEQGPIEVPKTIIPKGKFVARFDLGKGELSSLKGSESQTILIQNKKVGQVTNSLHIASLKKEILNASEVASLKSLYSAREKATLATSLYIKPSPEKAEASIHIRELGEATLESLLAELKKAESSPDPNFDSTALYLKFKSLIYLHPESCETLGRVLSRAGAKSLAMRLLPKALSTIGHPQAQAALVKAIEAHSEDMNTLFALINPLATVTEPTEEAEEVLRKMAFDSKDPDIRAMTQLALGAQARRIASFSPERADKIADRFLEELKRSSSPEMTKQLLLALGNAGSSRALSEISKLATSSLPDLRATALHALRFIDSPQAERLLMDAVRSDLDGSVRVAAANALGYRKMTEASFKTQKEIFLKDANVNVRLKVLDNLRKTQQAFPEVRRLIKKAASEDPSEDVRKAAKNIMAQYPESNFK